MSAPFGILAAWCAATVALVAWSSGWDVRRIVAVALVGAGVVFLAAGIATRATAQTTGCEHSSNFHAPPGCPDDGSGPRNPDGTPAPYPWSSTSSAPAATAVVATPAVTG